MKIAVIGTGFVAQILSTFLKNQDVTFFTSSKSLSKPVKRFYSFNKKELYLTKPVFKTLNGSLDIWGGVIAIPKYINHFDLVKYYNPKFFLNHFLKNFYVSDIYGINNKDIHSIFKLKKQNKNIITNVIKEEVQVISKFRSRYNLKTLNHTYNFDKIFVCTGSSSTTVEQDNKLYFVKPKILYDKLISIHPCTTNNLHFLRNINSFSQLSIPIQLPIDNLNQIPTIYNYINFKYSFNKSYENFNFIFRSAPKLLKLSLNKLSSYNKNFYFSTWSGTNSYPIKVINDEFIINNQMINKFEGNYFMSCLHYDVRTTPYSNVFKNVFNDQLSPNSDPILYNPVFFRFLKLYQGV